MMLTSLLFREMKENWTSVLVAEERFLKQKSKLQSQEATIKSVLLVRSASTRWTQQTLLMALTMKSIVSTVTRRFMEKKQRQSQCRLTPLQLEVMGNSEHVQGALEKCLLQRKWWQQVDTTIVTVFAVSSALNPWIPLVCAMVQITRSTAGCAIRD